MEPITRPTVAFILSTGRAGSTWVSYVLGSNEKSAFLGEYFRCFSDWDGPDCNYCHAKGFGHCQVLGDLGGVSEDEAFSYAFNRFKKPLIVDCSKNKDWTDRFLGQKSFDIKLIYLIREPRGWYASQKKRHNWTLNEAIKKWIASNNFIQTYVKEMFSKHGIEHFTVFYDDLARWPEKSFGPLFEGLGLAFNERSLDYWNFEHHGPAGNGPAFNLFGSFANAQVTTGDDAFYKENLYKQYYDIRWKSELTSEEIANIEKDPGVISRLESLDRTWADFMI